MCGSTARVSAAGPKKCSSNSDLSSSSVVSSTAPTWVRPALLTSTSIRPHRSIASSTADSRWRASVTSSAIVYARSQSASSESCSARLAVATTVSPEFSAASTIARPKPLAAPVINHTLLWFAVKPGARLGRDVLVGDEDAVALPQLARNPAAGRADQHADDRVEHHQEWREASQGHPRGGADDLVRDEQGSGIDGTGEEPTVGAAPTVAMFEAGDEDSDGREHREDPVRHRGGAYQNPRNRPRDERQHAAEEDLHRS